MSAQEAILKFLSRQQDIYLGYSEILFVAFDAVKETQAGYFAIAHDETGDPILIDTTHPDLRICTATQHAAPAPEPIADSIYTFSDILARLRILATGRENPVAKELNPLSAQEAQEFLKFVKSNNPKSELGYWETLMLLALENDPAE